MSALNRHGLAGSMGASPPTSSTRPVTTIEYETIITAAASAA